MTVLPLALDRMMIWHRIAALLLILPSAEIQVFPAQIMAFVIGVSVLVFLPNDWSVPGKTCGTLLMMLLLHAPWPVKLFSQGTKIPRHLLFCTTVY